MVRFINILAIATAFFINNVNLWAKHNLTDSKEEKKLESKSVNSPDNPLLTPLITPEKWHLEFNTVDGALNVEHQDLRGAITLPLFERAIPIAKNKDNNNKLAFSPTKLEQLNIWNGQYQLATSSHIELIERHINGTKKYLPYTYLTGDFHLDITKKKAATVIQFQETASLPAFKQTLKFKKTQSVEVHLPQLEWILDPMAQKSKRIRLHGYSQQSAYVRIGRRKYPVQNLALRRGNAGNMDLIVSSEKKGFTFQVILKGVQQTDKNFQLESISIQHQQKVTFANFPVNGNKLTIPFLKLNLELDGKVVKGTGLNGYDMAKITEVVGQGGAKGLNLNELKLDDTFLKALKTHSDKVKGEMDNASSNGTATNFQLPIDLTDHLRAFLGKYLASNQKYAFPENARLILVGLELNKDNTEAKARLLLTVKAHKQVFVFGAADALIAPNKVGFGETDKSKKTNSNLKLYTTQDYEIVDNQMSFDLKKIINPKAEEGSYAELSCDGFVGFNIQADYKHFFKLDTKSDECNEVNKKVALVNTNDVEEIAKQREKFLKDKSCRSVLKQQLTLPFTIKNKDLNNFVAPINVNRVKNPFLLNQFESVLFRPVAGNVYRSSRLENVDPKSSIAQKVVLANKGNFTGVHFSKLDVQVFGIGNGKEGDGPSHFMVKEVADFFITPAGLTGSHKTTGLSEKIDIGGWQTILQTFKFEVENSVVGTPFNQEAITADYFKNGGAYIGGKIMLPVVDQNNEENWMAFGAGLGYDDISHAASAFLRIEETELGKEFDLPMWGAFKMQIGTNVDAPTAAITLHLNEDSDDYWNKSEFEPFANISGIFIVDFKGSKPEKSGFYKEEGFMPYFNIPKLSFTEWKINDPGIYNRCKSSEGTVGGIKNMTFGSFGVGGSGGAGTVNQEGNSDVQRQVYSGLQGKGLSVWDVNFNCNSADATEGYKIDFELHVNLIGNVSDQKKSDFELNKDQVSGVKVNTKKGASTASAQAGKGGKTKTTLGGSASQVSKQQPKQKPKKISELKMVGQLQVHTGYKKEQFETAEMRFLKVSPEAFLINAEFSLFDFNGGCVLINDDPTFGKGFKGYLDILISKVGIGAKAVVQWGKTDYDDSTGQEGGDDATYDYGFFDLEVFKQQGKPIPKTPLFFHGLGAGFQINMIAEDTSPGESFNSARKKKAKNVGEVSHDSGILSEEADPYGYLLPGKSLSGLIFKPRPEVFGFGGKVILSMGGNALLAWGDLGFNISFTTDMVPLKANLRGNAYLLTPTDDDCQGPHCPPIGDPSAAAGLGAMEVELNFEKGYFIATASIELEYPASPSQSQGDKHLNKAAFINTGKAKKLPDDIQTFATRTFGEANFMAAWKDPSTTVDIPLEKAGEWSLKIGSPEEGVGMEFKFLGITLGRMEAYLQAGHHLDPIPTIAELVPEWDTNDASQGKTRKSDPGFGKISSGKGMIFGARFKIPDNTVEFLMFRARLAAGAGFDVSFLKYDAEKAKRLNCSDGDGKFGLNNWYARGQAYAYIKAVLDIHINLIFIDEWFNIFDAYAAAVLQAELPNPTWLRAMIKARFSVLNGAITGKVNFKAEIGTRCKMNQALMADMPIIAEIAPENTVTEVPIYQNPVIAFNFPVNKPVVITEYIEKEDELETKDRTFRAFLSKFEIREKGRKETVSGQFSYATDNYSASFFQTELLKPNAEYEIIAEATWQEWVSGEWKPYAYIDENKSLAIYVEKTSPEIYTFKTGGLPTTIASEMLEYQAPGYGQRFWHKDYAVPQLLFKQEGNSFFFANNSTQLKKDYPDKGKNLPEGIPLVYAIELTEYDASSGNQISVQKGDLGQFPGKDEKITKFEIAEKQGKNLNYSIPYIKPVVTEGKSVTYADWEAFGIDATKKGKYFKLAIKRAPKAAFNATLTSNIETKEEEKAYGQEKVNSGGKTEEAGASITRRVTRLKNAQVPSGQELLYETIYEYHFAISDYNSLYEKLASYTVEPLNEAFSLPQVKYDHPDEEKVFDPLPLVKPYKDHHFVAVGGKEGLDGYDQQKLLGNLMITNPIEAVNTKGLIHPSNPHPFEQSLYLKDTTTSKVAIPIDFKNIYEMEARFVPKNVKLVSDGNKLKAGVTAMFNGQKEVYAIKSDGSRADEGKLGYAYFYEEIPTVIFHCNKASDQVSRGFKLNQISNNEVAWLSLTKGVLKPYYQVNFELANKQKLPWAFQLRFNDDSTIKQFDVSSSNFSFEQKLMAYKQPDGKIN
ncbi:MAG: hypothetical protein AAF960_19935, partial [Bacteroidota bacterium]